MAMSAVLSPLVPAVPSAEGEAHRASRQSPPAAQRTGDVRSRAGTGSGPLYRTWQIISNWLRVE